MDMKGLCHSAFSLQADYVRILGSLDPSALNSSFTEAPDFGPCCIPFLLLAILGHILPSYHAMRCYGECVSVCRGRGDGGVIYSHS